MLGTAGVLFASQARADGVDSALGALFGMVIILVVLGGLALVVGAGTLFFNLTRRHNTASIVLGLLVGLGTMRLGSWTASSFTTEEWTLADWGLTLGGVGLFLLGAGEVIAAVMALRAGSSRSAAPKTAQE
ncbi:hypothetical protein D7X96_11390 [Corallococcus interemptor]|uniref:Uncharacterized protein n=1 Tax=Corallococcus interemptor TaxID=2316720 RepID=A0A3A8QVJ1_9BACT|nr:hypothetical protein [Corallococcus interemptor]RKH70455.1 hypothetical protein D7X96_11390 [Corallococcus interemptor]